MKVFAVWLSKIIKIVFLHEVVYDDFSAFHLTSAKGKEWKKVIRLHIFPTSLIFILFPNHPVCKRLGCGARCGFISLGEHLPPRNILWALFGRIGVGMIEKPFANSLRNILERRNSLLHRQTIVAIF